MQGEFVTEPLGEPDLSAIKGLAIDYSMMTLKELRSLAKERQIPSYSSSSKARLIERLSV
jgi:hypothetical protein